MRPALLLLICVAIACGKSTPRHDTAGGGPPDPIGGGKAVPPQDGGSQTDGGGSTCGETAIVNLGFTPKRVLYIAPDGNDGRDGGSRATAWRTFANLATRLEPGDRVDVSAGNYSCGARITVKGTADAPVWIRSVDGPRKAALDCSGVESGFELFRATYVVIDGFEMRSAARDLVRVHSGVPPFSEVSDHVVVIGNHLFSPGQSGVRVEQSSNVDVVGNDIHDTEALGPSLFGQGIDMVGVTNARVVGNAVHNIPSNTAIQVRAGTTGVVSANLVYDVLEGFSLGGTSEQPSFLPSGAAYEAKNVLLHSNVIALGVGTSIAARGCVDCAVVNNTLAVYGATRVVRALPGASASGAISHTSGLRFVNNIVHISRSSPQRLFDVPAGEGAGFDQRTNLFYVEGGSAGGVPSDVTVAGAAGTIVDRDPRFVDLAKSDLRLQEGSPAIGAGTTVPEVRYDAAFNCRTRFNIGAH